MRYKSDLQMPAFMQHQNQAIVPIAAVPDTAFLDRPGQP